MAKAAPSMIPEAGITEQTGKLSYYEESKENFWSLSRNPLLYP
jgi:hypothetical protein